jgi:hypothetical protein
MKYCLTDEVKHATSELVGISSSMVYDGEIDDKEIAFLQAWLQHHKDVRNRWPVSDLFSIVNTIVADGTITQDERKSLYKFLQTIALTDTDPDSRPSPNVIQGIYSEGKKIDFINKVFMFTGNLVFDERKNAMTAVIKRGGVCLKTSSITPNIDYLIVGSLGSENWASGKFGRKIESALTLQKNKASKILIIKEDDFVQSLFETPIITDKIPDNKGPKNSRENKIIMEVNFHEVYKEDYQKAIAELYHLVDSIVRDTIIDANEVQQLTDFCYKNALHFQHEPFKSLIKLLDKVLADGVVTDAEQNEFMAFLKNIEKLDVNN